MKEPAQGNGENLTRRQALLRGGAAIGGAALASAGLALIPDSRPPEHSDRHEPLVRRMPKGTLVLLGGQVEPGHKIWSLAAECHIPAEKCKPPHGFLERLTQQEYAALAARADIAGVFTDMEKLCSMRGKTVICVTSASENAVVNAQLDKIVFRLLGAKEVVAITDRKQADLPGMAAMISNPKNNVMVYFDGGAQGRLARAFTDTLAHKAVMRRYLNDPDFIVAGSSAGAAVVPGEGHMIAGWNKEETKPVLSTGLGLLESVIVDTHLHRNPELPRLPRLQKALCACKDAIGIGLDEGTGVVIKNGVATVVGKGKAWKMTQEQTEMAPGELDPIGIGSGGRIQLGRHAYLHVPAHLLSQDAQNTIGMR